MDFKVTCILIAILLGLQSCYFWRKPDDDTNNMCFRVIVNQSNQNVILKVFNESNPQSHCIKQDSHWLLEKLSLADEIKPFEGLNSALDSVMISLEDGKALKIWRKSEKATDIKHFFNEDSWEKREWKEGDYRCYEWTFHLTSEDLQN